MHVYTLHIRMKRSEQGSRVFCSDCFILFCFYFDCLVDPRQTEEGRNVSAIPFEQLEGLCQSLMDAGVRAVKVMASISSICGEFILDSSYLLNQVVGKKKHKTYMLTE